MPQSAAADYYVRGIGAYQLEILSRDLVVINAATVPCDATTLLAKPLCSQQRRNGICNPLQLTLRTMQLNVQ